MALPVIYSNGVLNELPAPYGVAPAPRVLVSPVLADVGDEELVYDSLARRLVLRQGDFLILFAQSVDTVSTPGQLDFSIPDNSFWWELTL